MKGLVFDIQRYSIHDGPGIRTVVFLKGCPLRCLWCSNPESQKGTIELEFRSRLCEHCGLCIPACPENAIHPDLFAAPEEKINFLRCNLCGECKRACPTGALHLIGQEYTAAEILQQVLKDDVFYRRSGGGMTLSGGEPFYQPDFSLELLHLCYERGIHTAVETTGHVDWSVLAQALSITDLFLFDIKHLDAQLHTQYTGVSNTVILANLSRLVESGANIILRVPLIPKFNLDKEHLRAVGELASHLEIKEIHLMPFHQFGRDKYTRLCRPNLMGDTKGLQDTPEGREQIDRAVHRVSRQGIKVLVGG